MTFRSRVRLELDKPVLCEDREVGKIAQAFANQKAADKRRNGGGGKARGGRGNHAGAEAGNGSVGRFTMLDLEAVEALAKRIGGYEPLGELVRFLADRR